MRHLSHMLRKVPVHRALARVRLLTPLAGEAARNSLPPLFSHLAHDPPWLAWCRLAPSPTRCAYRSRTRALRCGFGVCHFLYHGSGWSWKRGEECLGGQSSGIAPSPFPAVDDRLFALIHPRGLGLPPRSLPNRRGVGPSYQTPRKGIHTE